MTDRYAVIGNPIEHSKSPVIHAEFARQTGQDMSYGKILAPLDGFASTVRQFIADGGKGMNVTVPFKQEAFELCDELSERARRAEAVNTLIFRDGRIVGDNTDGVGLVNDLVNNHHTPLHNKSVLILGAGGAVRGILQPLLSHQPRRVFIANRTASKAEALAAAFADLGPVEGGSFEQANAEGAFDVIINGTSASLGGELPPLAASLIAPHTTAYDMMYGNSATVFNQWAAEQGAARCIDGLGMLVGQAAEAFRLWRGVSPDTASVMKLLRG